MPKQYHNPPPEDVALEGAPDEAVKREFAKRLQAAMVEKGWNQSELSRQAAAYMEDGKFGRDNVSGYIRALTIPTPPFLDALCKALGKKPNELLPKRATADVDQKVPPLDVRDIQNGKAWLRVNQAVDWPVAIKIMALLKGDDADDK